MKSHFHMKGWAPRLTLRERLKGIRKWPSITQFPCTCVPRGKSRPQQICNVMTEVCFMILKIVTAVSVIQKLPEIARATTTSPEVMAFYEHLTSKRYVW